MVVIIKMVLISFLIFISHAAYSGQTTGPQCNLSTFPDTGWPDTGWPDTGWQVRQNRAQQHDRQADHFALVLSWSPGFCAWQQQRHKELPRQFRFQCDSGNRFGWILHGLWGQSEKGISAGNDGSHPAWCGDTDGPDLPPALLRRHACMSPGAKLLQHEWEKHGRCDFDDAEAYFGAASRLYWALTLPNRFIKGQAMLDWLNRHNSHLQQTSQAWLKNGREVAICFDRDFQPMDCR